RGRGRDRGQHDRPCLSRTRGSRADRDEGPFGHLRGFHGRSVAPAGARGGATLRRDRTQTGSRRRRGHRDRQGSHPRHLTVSRPRAACCGSGCPCCAPGSPCCGFGCPCCGSRAACCAPRVACCRFRAACCGFRVTATHREGHEVSDLDEIVLVPGVGDRHVS